MEATKAPSTVPHDLPLRHSHFVRGVRPPPVVIVYSVQSFRNYSEFSTGRYCRHLPGHTVRGGEVAVRGCWGVHIPSVVAQLAIHFWNE